MAGNTDTSSVQSEVGPEKTYFDALARGVWQIQSCQQCGRAVFYPRNVCPYCGGDRLDWFTPSGKGTVYSASTIYRAPEAGGDYNVSLIDLDEGVRLMGGVEGCPPADVKIGMRVNARIGRPEQPARLVFELAGDRA